MPDIARHRLATGAACAVPVGQRVAAAECPGPVTGHPPGLSVTSSTTQTGNGTPSGDRYVDVGDDGATAWTATCGESTGGTATTASASWGAG